MDTAQWPQEIGLVKPLEEMISDTCSRPPPLTDQRRTRPPKEQSLNCPRCNSLNTKFCYYNNYSLTQPRYFCKTCRRYWTEGGSLRNVPVGGGSRKNKRPSSSSSAKKSPDLISQNPKENNFHQGHDLNLSFHTTQEYPNMSEFVELQGIQNHNNNSSDVTTTPTTTTTSLSALELLRSGISSRGLNSFMPMPMAESNPVYASRFGLHDQFRPSLNFPVEGLGGAYGDVQGEDQQTSGRLLFPFEDLKPVTNPNFEQQNRGQGDSPGYWTGMLGGGFL